MILCEWDAPEGDPGQTCVHLFARILSTSFSSVSIFSVCCYSIVSISMVWILVFLSTVMLISSQHSSRSRDSDAECSVLYQDCFQMYCPDVDPDHMCNELKTNNFLQNENLC
jgi:hypothetical protein